MQISPGVVQCGERMASMRIASVDIESTGLNPEYCQVIEIGIVLDDLDNQLPLDQLPRFHCYVDHHVFRGDPFALSMHPVILRRIAEKEPPYLYLPPKGVAKAVRKFLDDHGYVREDGKKLNVAGKNFGTFDWPFLKALPDFDQKVKIAHRIIDPSILFWRKGDENLPGTDECYKRAGITRNPNAHTAIEDCLGVIELVRAGMQRLSNIPMDKQF